ncbi:MAG: hypothetical protein AAF393_00040 [Pseudomonadota bacterium]
MNNNYLVTPMVLIMGAVLSAGYSILATAIPLLIVGAFLGFIIVIFGHILLYGLIRGSKGYRVATFIVAYVLNMAAIWFAFFSWHWGIDAAVAIFSAGPGAVFFEITDLAYRMRIGFGEVEDFVAGGPKLTITGGGLLALWGFEAIAFAALTYFAYTVCDENQNVSMQDHLQEAGSNVRSELLPAIGRLLWGTVKGLIPVALVVGVIYLVMEYL